MIKMADTGWAKFGEEPKPVPKPIKRPGGTPVGRAVRQKTTTPVKKTPNVWGIDSREPGKMSGLFDIYKMKYKIYAMDSGDIELGEPAGERKTIADFIGSYKSGRVFDQLERLSKRTSLPFLFVTGTPKDYEAAMNKISRFKGVKFDPDQMIGAIGSCLCRYNINLIWVRTDADMVRCIRALFPHLKNIKVPLERPQSYTMLTGDMATLRELWGTKEYRDNSIGKDIASIIANGTNIVWTYSEGFGLHALAKMFKKINEGKYCAPRKKLVKKSGAGRSADLLRNFLRIEGNLAASLTRAAKQKKKGVLRYIMESPNEVLLGHSGMGPVTLKRIRSMIG